jgi:biotin carboxyl carrier protein
MADQSGVNDARALLRDFLKSDWKALQIETGSLKAFFSRDPAVRAVARTAPTEPTFIAELIAPHLGTLASIVAPGTSLAAGDVYSHIEVLGKLRPLHTDAAGVVSAHHFAPGALVEYGQRVATLSA